MRSTSIILVLSRTQTNIAYRKINIQFRIVNATFSPTKSHHTSSETFSHNEMNINNKQIWLPSTIDKHGVHVPWDSNVINNNIFVKKNEAITVF